MPRLRLISTLWVSLVMMAKCLMLQPKENVKYGLYVYLSKTCPEAHRTGGAPRTTQPTWPGKTLPVLQYLRNCCLRKINKLCWRPAALFPRPGRKQPVCAEFIPAAGILAIQDPNFNIIKNSPRLQVNLNGRNWARFHFSLKYQNCWQLNLIVWISSLTECTAGLWSSPELAGKGKSICKEPANVPQPGRAGL